MLSLFDFELRKIQPSLCLDQRWMNGPNDYSGAISGPAAPRIPIGAIVSVYNHRILMIGTRLGNFIVFQKDDNPTAMISYQCSGSLDHILSFPETTLTYDEFNRVFHPSENIGFWVESVRNIMMNSYIEVEVRV